MRPASVLFALGLVLSTVICKKPDPGKNVNDYPKLPPQMNLDDRVVKQSQTEQKPRPR
jgi:hypothetical protein